ncbi:hypothetical protein ACFVAV_04530 [Nocardia sp. NPDC057663]|uniref:hypothetical protein n=1 Tax=Nocardia sp. NPDC057663 TaxID=3346201 RepID=UPI00366C1326
MANWPALSPGEQQDKLADITRDILETLPERWTRLIVRAMMIGPHAEADTGIKMADGPVRSWSFPPEVWRKFQQLRKGMYAEGAGSWIEFEYILDPPGKFSIRYNRDSEPQFSVPPTNKNFTTENKWFPRSDESMPEWFRRGLNS